MDFKNYAKKNNINISIKININEFLVISTPSCNFPFYNFYKMLPKSYDKSNSYLMIAKY